VIKHNTWVKAFTLIALSILTVVDVFCAGMLAIIAAPTMSGYYTGSSLYHVMYRFYPYTDAFITAVVICTIAIIALFIFLMAAAGHKKGKEGITVGALDRVYLEIYLLVAGGIEVLLGAGAYLMIWWALDMTEYLWLAALFGAMMVAVLMLTMMTIAIRIKSGTFWRSTLMGAIVRVLWKGMKWCIRILRMIPSVWRGVLIVSGVFAFYILLSIRTFNYHAPFAVLLWFVYPVAVLALVVVYLYQFKQLRLAGKELAGGNLDHKVDTKYMFIDMKSHAENLNQVGDAAALAANERLKSERFRTELITNVSHDIKTPLTALISYIDLMKREGLQSENAEEYLAVLDRQSQRLKKLTDDLVEASKAASGTLPVNCMKMNLAEFLDQCAAEYEDVLQKCDLQIVMGQSADVHIWADGRHIWRVFDNIFSNIRKYAMPGTRVYVDSYCYDGNVTVMVRNISKAQLNISPDELMERFVRGDASRSEAEGSGLGLSIAASLMKLQNGTFDVFINGDMFTASVTMPQYVG